MTKEHYRGLKLDPFQVETIRALDRGNSVILSAPTGCGKTLTAEYLIDRSLSGNERIIYTAPIKALSNQKFRDFSRLYPGKVGIMTGDTIINPEAPVLIMTTEIFRNMLFTDLESLEGTSSVVFDEIHFINDMDRGVIWEESIIFAPPWMRFLCLSATISNADELAGWISEIKGHEVELIVHHERPVELSHHVFETTGTFMPLEDFFDKFRDVTPKKLPDKYARRISPLPLTSVLARQKMLPCIWFAFSRARTIQLAEEAARKFDFSVPGQKERVYELFDKLTEKYDIQKLNAFDMIREAAARGIGVHNAGIIPPIKEIIEELFSEGLLKLLFVTETFAVGVNMPARAVVFDNPEKYDGVNFRYMLTREYYQMAGRAGRRGIDLKGTVVSVVDTDVLDMEKFTRMTTGVSEPLESQFQISYNTVLNLTSRYNEEEAVQVLSLSFAKYQQRKFVELHESHISSKRREIRGLIGDSGCAKPMTGKNYIRLYDEFEMLEGELEATRKKFKSTPKKAKQRRFALRRESRGMEKKINALRRRIKKTACARCPDLEGCMAMHRRLAVLEDEIRVLDERKEGMVGPGLENLFHRKKRFLQAYGFIKCSDDTLTSKGNVASRIYGYEIAGAEMIFSGLLEEATPEEAAIMAVCTVWEADRRGYRPAGLKKGHTADMLRKMKRIISNVRKTERQFDLIPTRTYCVDPAAAAESWINGAPLHEVTALSDSSEGDFIRLMRTAIDFLRQLKRVAAYDQSSSIKLKTAIAALNRDVVQACEDFGTTASDSQPSGASGDSGRDGISRP